MMLLMKKLVRTSQVETYWYDVAVPESLASLQQLLAHLRKREMVGKYRVIFVNDENELEIVVFKIVATTEYTYKILGKAKRE